MFAPVATKTNKYLYLTEIMLKFASTLINTYHCILFTNQ